MKNKYLTRSLCVTILSAMVLSSPMSVMAADEHIETASDLGDGSGEVISDGSDTPAPEPEHTGTGTEHTGTRTGHTGTGARYADTGADCDTIGTRLADTGADCDAIEIQLQHRSRL
ncbi:MAG: hypothetical protein ACLUN4_11420 [Lachnospiraceae bacterium]